MAYDKNVKEGVILQINEFGESGRLVKILTHEGIKSLVATGVRELKSKMRSSIDVLSLVDFEFVEGKEVLRLVGIFPQRQLLNFESKNIIQKRRVVSNLVNFLQKTVVGEIENTELFDKFIFGIERLQKENFGVEGIVLDEKSENFKSLFEVFEVVWLIQILITLGYWEEGLYDKFELENFKYILENKKIVSEEVNNALKSTHLLHG